MSTFESQRLHVNAPNQREGIAWSYSQRWHWQKMISAAQEKQRYEIALSSTGEGIRQSGQVRYAMYILVGRSGDRLKYRVQGICGSPPQDATRDFISSGSAVGLRRV
jgi:hypothetical protein